MHRALSHSSAVKATGSSSLIPVFRIPELNLLALAFLPLLYSGGSLAILHIDHQDRLQLLSRDINITDLEMSPAPSTLLPSTSISSRSLPLTESLPTLIPIPPSLDDESDAASPGSILVVGGRKLLLYELASIDWQEKQKGKRRRLDSRKRSMDSSEVIKAKEKEKEREVKKRKPKATIEWPWSEVTA